MAAQRPKVILWYHIYCVILTVMYLLVTLAGAALFFFPAETLEMEEAEKVIVAALCVGICLPLVAASAFPLMMSPKPWLWVYGIILIALGLTSCCFWPICIPLLIYWLKPETQIHFGRTP